MLAEDVSTRFAQDFGTHIGGVPDEGAHETGVLQ